MSDVTRHLFIVQINVFFNAFLHSSIFNEKKNQLVIWRDYHNAENYHGLVFVLLSWLCKIVTPNEK